MSDDKNDERNEPRSFGAAIPFPSLPEAIHAAMSTALAAEDVPAAGLIVVMVTLSEKHGPMVVAEFDRADARAHWIEMMRAHLARLHERQCAVNSFGGTS